jgi:hypothetical protein
VPPDGPAEPEPPRALRCTIRGTGERAPDNGHAPFEVFASPSAPSPAVVINKPWTVHVTFSDLPRSGSARPAKVTLGGQKLLKLTGWASLAGRTFQVQQRVDVHAGHLWVRGGSRVEILGSDSGRLRVRATTPFEAPAQVEGLTACNNLAYEPVALARREDDKPPQGAHAVLTGLSLHLHTAPRGPALLSLIPGDEEPALHWIEERDDFVRVAGVKDDIAFDAWVPAAEVERPHGGRLRGSWRSRCGGIRMSVPTVPVLHDAQIRVGAEPSGDPVGLVEEGAEVVLGEERGQLVAFSFKERELVAPEGKQFWVHKSAVGR